VDLPRAKQDHLLGPFTVDFLLALTVAAVGAAFIVRKRMTRPVTAP
jgi:hypothetical protein